MDELGPRDPRRLGPYRIVRQLGWGRMGQVYLGDSAGVPLAAITVIDAPLAGDQDFRARLEREIAAARNVSSPFTAPVTGADLTGPRPWLGCGSS